MSVLPPLLGQDSPMSIERITLQTKPTLQILIIPSKAPTMTTAQSLLMVVVTVMAMPTLKCTPLTMDTLLPVHVLSSWLLVHFSFILGTLSPMCSRGIWVRLCIYI